MPGKFSPSGYPPFLLPKQNLGGHKFKDREVEARVTRWLVTQSTDRYQHGIETRQAVCL
jgi:hypothetical protein